jgi:maltose alpha-D-glucosyltransferase/alpha-amylase
VAPDASRLTAPTVDGLHALLMGADWQGVLDGGTRTVLEERALVPFLRRQRWFASKARDIRRAWFTDWARLREGAQPSFLTVTSLEYLDGWLESYFLPLALVAEDEARTFLNERLVTVLAHITGARKGAIVDGFQDDETCDRVLDVMANGTEIRSVRGNLRGSGGPRGATGSSGSRRSNVTGERRWLRSGGDQSNSVAFLDDALVLKLFRRIEPDINPEYEIGRFLTERGFPRAPRLTGGLEYVRPGLNPGTLAVAETVVKHQGSGWDVATNELRRYFERMAASGSVEAAPGPLFTEVADRSLQNAETLGKRTAQLHMTLASGATDAFAPEPLDRPAITRMAQAMIEHANSSLDLLRRSLERIGKSDQFDEFSQSRARAVLEATDALRSRFDDLRALDSAGLRIRVHGDYHLGQVLRTADDFVILDFEGEPDRPIKERRAKQSPVKDVAGMVRSFGYAAYAALLAFTLHAPDTYELLEPWAGVWQRAISEAFTSGYLAAIAAGGTAARLFPDGLSDPAAPPRWWTALVRAFVLDKALYELAYELNNRPDWVRIPLIGILQLKE